MPAVNRRALLTLGASAAATLALPTATASASPDSPSTPVEAAAAIAAVYARESTSAGGNWRAYITVATADGSLIPAVDTRSTESVSARSTNKLAVAATVLDRLDKGQTALSTTLTVDESYVEWDGDGVIPYDGAYPSTISLGHNLALLLSISEDTASSLCSQIVTATDVNAHLAELGFVTTRVRTIPDSPRWYLGYTTAREMHDLWYRLTHGTLLSAASTTYMLKILRSAEAFREGVRSHLSTPRRTRIATKAGWYGNERAETGVVFDANGAPVVTYAMYADHPDGADDFSGNNPLVAARARMGGEFLRIVDCLAGAA